MPPQTSLGEGRLISTSGKGDDPRTGTYDFGPRVGKVKGLMIDGRPATREQALQVLRQEQAAVGGMAAEQVGRRRQAGQELGEFARYQGSDEYIRDVMRDILPMAAFPALGRLGFIKGTLAGGGLAAAGGQLGEMIDQSTGSYDPNQPDTFADWLTRRGKDVAVGAGMELGGRTLGGALSLAGKPVGRVLGGALKEEPSLLRERIGREYGFHFTPAQAMEEYSASTGRPSGLFITGEESRAGHNPYSKSIARSGIQTRRTAARSTVAGLINHLGPEVPANISGRRVAEAIEGVGKPAWQRQVNRLKSLVDAKASKTMIDVTPLKADAKVELDQMANQLMATGQYDVNGEGEITLRWPNTQKVRMIREVANFPDFMPFSNLATKRSDWMGVSPQLTELISGEAKGTAKHYTEMSTRLLDEAAKIKPFTPGSDFDSWVTDQVYPYRSKERRTVVGRTGMEVRKKYTEVLQSLRDELAETTDPARRSELEDLIKQYKIMAEEAQRGGGAPVRSGMEPEFIKSQVAEYNNTLRNLASTVQFYKPDGSLEAFAPTSLEQRLTIVNQAAERAKAALVELRNNRITFEEINEVTSTLPVGERTSLRRAKELLTLAFRRELPPNVRGFEQDWNRYRNFTRKGADVFESKIITDAVNKNPEDVVRMIKGDDITDVLRVRRAIKGYAEHFGDTTSKLRGLAAWKKFQVAYLRDNIVAPLDGDMTKLADALDKLSSTVKKAVFDDPESQRTMLRLTQIAKALKDADKGLGVLMGHQYPFADLTTHKGWFRSVRPIVVAKIAWSPRATQFYLRGLAGLAENPPSDNALKDFVTQSLLGKGSQYALRVAKPITNRRLGAAMADIIRAYDIAEIDSEAKADDTRSQKWLNQLGQQQQQEALRP